MDAASLALYMFADLAMLPFFEWQPKQVSVEIGQLFRVGRIEYQTSKKYFSHNFILSLIEYD